jgi:hypothetical protein
MPAGRPTKLTAEVIEDVQRLMPQALYLETVADLIGVTRRTMYGWLKRGGKEARRLENPKANPEEAEAIYAEFFLTYKKALAKGQLRDLQIIGKAAEEQWQAAAWKLERRFPDLWGRDRGDWQQVRKEVEEIKKSVAGQAKAHPVDEAAA